MYILLNKNNVVQENIPDIDPTFPGIPIEERYTEDFVKRMVHVADDEQVTQGMVYDTDTGTFSLPPPPAPEETTQTEQEIPEAQTEGGDET